MTIERDRSESTLGWRPLLDGDLAAEANGAAAEVANAILQSSNAINSSSPRQSPELSAGLSPALVDGQAGLALLAGYSARCDVDGAHADAHADALLWHAETATEDLAQRPALASLYGGFPGVAWTLEHFADQFFDFDEDPNEDVDPALLEAVKPGAWHGPFDLINGLVGLGVYALERLPQPQQQPEPEPQSQSVAILEHIVRQLRESSTRADDGICWWTSPGHLPRQTRRLYPQGHCNVGVAHGVPGVIGLLGRVVAAGVAVDEASSLLDGAVSWLLAQRLEGEASTFPAVVDPRGQGTAEASRLGWCYGDAGIAAVLLGTAKRLDRADWHSAALEVALAAAQRQVDTSGVRDASLCHGAAGLGHLFNRLFQATGEPQLGAAARSWFERTLAYRQAGGAAVGGNAPGIAGFWVQGPSHDDSGSAQRALPGFLNGAAGIALALLAATTDVEPSWDRLLLASMPHQAEVSPDSKPSAKISV